MLNRMEVFLEQCLTGIDQGAYRERLCGELRQHMSELVQRLEEAGYGSSAAQEEALRRMGDPAEINRSCREEWLRRQSRELGYCLRHGWQALIRIWALSWLCGMALSLVGFTSDVIYANRITFMMMGSPTLCFVYGAVGFLIPFCYGAWQLRKFFRFHRSPRLIVTGVLLFAWGVKVFSTALPLAWCYGLSLMDWNGILTAACHGNEFTAPWFSMTYLMATFVGCVLLGCVGGRERIHQKAFSR